MRLESGFSLLGTFRSILALELRGSLDVNAKEDVCAMRLTRRKMPSEVGILLLLISQIRCSLYFLARLSL